MSGEDQGHVETSPEREGAQPADQDPVRLAGTELEPEEMAALTAVLDAVWAHADPPPPLPGRSGQPPRVDRTLQRRGDLGLWARPGEGQWHRGVGPQ